MAKPDEIDDSLERAVFEMYDRRIITNGYVPFRDLPSRINFDKWAGKYGRSWDAICKDLKGHGLLHLPKKKRVISLGKRGVQFAIAVQKKYSIPPREKRL